MHRTSNTDVNALLDELLSQMRESIGANLVGLYLYGSLTAGDFDCERSDIDLLAATASEISDSEFNALERLHNRFTGGHAAWEDRLDIAYISVAALKTFGAYPRQIAVISPGEPFHRKEAEHGWLMNWYVVREYGLTLFGPPPRAIIPTPLAYAAYAIR